MGESRLVRNFGIGLALWAFAATLVALILEYEFPRAVDIAVTIVVILSVLAGLVVGSSGVRVWLSSRKKDANAQPTPAAPLVNILIPENPRQGQIDNYEMAYFPKVLITKRTSEARNLRFTLSMPERSFEGFTEFQAIYRDRHGIKENYFSNPLHVDFINRQANLAFVHASGSSGVSDAWKLEVHDVLAEQRFTVSELGEATLCDDGSTQQA